MIVQTESGALVTRDLIGIDCTKELDLDVHVPFGFEKHLDLKSGKVYLERRKSSNASQSSEQTHRIDDQTFPKLQDLNEPPKSTIPLTLFDETDLELKLDSLSSSSSSSSSSNHQSVCTLGKVKFALERVEKETNKKRSISIMSESCGSPASNSSSSIKETTIDNHDKDDVLLEAYATGCPNCLLYVFISRTKPNCPRCNVIVPFPMLTKKPRIDLNIMI